MKRAITLAALALAVAGIFTGTAGGTPGSGVSSQLVRMPLGGIDLVLQSLTVAPGGTTGWHSHPGRTDVFVLAGAGTLYHADCMGHTFAAGQRFVQPANEVHIFRNEGATTVHVFATYFLPRGAPVRIDQPQPAGCSVN